MNFIVGMWIKTLDVLYKNDNISMTDVSKELQGTYSQVVKILNFLKSNNLIKMEKKGRKTLCVLTDKGKDIAKNTSPIVEFSKNAKKLRT